ncbi:MAG: hypothetical protein HY447_05725 [Candidatus Omnitrophica bacterium]|nr:hypothetical protein [Candidatus Omnitrophota bacterium]
MDKQEFFQKAEQALNQAFEATKKSVKVVAEKAGEAAHVTKLLVEKVSLEHQVNKQFARLGGCVYEKAAKQGKESFIQDPEIKSLVDEVKDLEADLAQVEATLENEKRQKKVAKRRTKS